VLKVLRTQEALFYPL